MKHLGESVTDVELSATDRVVEPAVGIVIHENDGASQIPVAGIRRRFAKRRDEQAYHQEIQRLIHRITDYEKFV